MVAGVHRIPGRLGLIGMGAALGAATRAPITAVVILFELTGEYSIILPLMAAVAMAAGTGRLLSKTTIYTAKLWRRGVDLDRYGARPPFTAAEIAGPAPRPLPADTELAHGRNDSRFISVPNDSVRGQDWALRRLSRPSRTLSRPSMTPIPRRR